MATDATGTPTTSLGIPKFNTAADIPSGKGFNTAMDYIDDLIEARGTNVPGATGVKIWNNATKSWETPGGGDGTKFLRDDGTFAAAKPLTYRKNTAKTVSNTIAATDLLNGEITIAANVVPATGIWRAKLFGTCSNGTGASQNELRFQVVLGGTTILDSGTSGVATIASSGGALPWEVEVECVQTNATNAAQINAWYRATHSTANTTQWLPVTGAGVVQAIVQGGGYIHVFGQFSNSHTKDMTAAQSLVVNVIQPVASAAFVTTLNGALVEII